MNKILNVEWGPHSLTENKIQYWRIGDLYLSIMLDNGEIRIAHQHKKINGTGRIKPEDIWDEYEWHRWDTNKGDVSIKFSPEFPDKPLVVKAENPFDLVSKAKKKIYVKVPIWIKISVEAGSSIKLISLPVVKLSKTWFGNFVQGETCYWISSGARTQFEPLPREPFLIICPLDLRNNSSSALKVEKICLRAAYLSIYKLNDHLWANEFKISFKGKNEVSELRLSERAPQEAPEAELLSSPKEKLKKSLVANSFSNLKDLPGFGFLSN